MAIPVSAATFRRIMNLWPPLLFSSIKIEKLAPDYSYCRVALRERPWNRNINRSHYGGSLFSMTDPFYALLLMGKLGRGYRVWDKSADIDFIKPGKGRLTAEFVIDEATIRQVRQATADGSKYLPKFVVEVKDGRGEVVCRLTRVLYVRKVFAGQDKKAA
ncbi:Acyl-coenzyme A thioesterase PaaI, contains HGG motif [Ferrimonas sediminum]|uniref:Acyl-coenzyme A thioesterase PaaI, contains HGG motif n=1 Tax=Ferrimonas sediminum TaxID=718193 RepID=A0A1G8R0F1_9GAMM|nr:DUF4442 domain-containing protein [Ferrimonas sediminum]SDJ10456.1 Acyl-coenzyme A thioesterase PaaI, contains HGG motif [Ferrimonas sediminum]